MKIAGVDSLLSNSFPYALGWNPASCWGYLEGGLTCLAEFFFNNFLDHPRCALGVWL